MAVTFLDDEPATSGGVTFLDDEPPASAGVTFLDDEILAGDATAQVMTRGGGSVVSSVLEASPANPSTSAVSDFFNRIGQSLTKSTMDAAAGGLKIMEDMQLPGTAALGTVKQLGGPDLIGGARQFAADVSDQAKTVYPTDAARDDNLSSAVAGAIGSIIPTLASGPVAPLTGAAMMGENARQEAEAADGSNLQKNAAFYSNAAVGLVSEKLMGLPALMKSVTAKAIPRNTFRKIVEGALWQVAKSSARESTQEGLEQVVGNLIASEVAQYAPDRPLFQGVGQAMAAGAIVGGPIGGIAQVASSLDSLAPATAGAVAEASATPPPQPPPLPISNAQPAPATSTTPATPETAPARVAPGQPATAEPVNPVARQGVTEPLPGQPPLVEQQLPRDAAETPEPVPGAAVASGSTSGAIRPALLAPDGTVLVEGKAGQTHGDVQSEAIRGGSVEAADATRAFVGADGKPMSRAEAWIAAKTTGEIKPKALAAKDGPAAELQSEDLIAHGRTPDAENSRSEGPGAAAASEFPEQRSTSTKNAVMEAERIARGADPILKEARQSNADTLERAETTLEQNPNRGREVVEKLRTSDVRDISVADEAVLLVEKVKLRNQRDTEADRAADPNAAPEERAVARVEWERLENEINDMDQATHASGAEWGRLGQFRQRMLRDDFTFEAMERKARVQKGESLTPEESIKIKAQAERIAELEGKLTEAQKTRVEKEGAKAADEATKKLTDEARKEDASDHQKGRKVDLGKQRENIVDGIRRRIEEGDSIQDLRDFVQRLALNLVRGGIKERDPLLAGVHKVLSEIVEGITPSQTRDLISGYGDFKLLSTEPAKVTLRGLKGELQQIGKIEDMMKKTAPKKTGIERRSVTDEERRLIKEVNELKKKGGFQVTDPATQLKTAMESIKTRLRNEIADLDNAISKREPIISKKGGIEYDAEAVKLKAQRDARKSEYDEMFPKRELTPEERITAAGKMLDRAIAELESDLKAGNLYAAKGSPVTSVGLEVKRARLNALRAERDTMRALDTAHVEARREKALMDAIESASKALPEPKSGTPTVDTERISSLRKELSDARERRKLARSLDTERVEVKREADLLKAIERTEAGVKERAAIVTADTQRVAELKEKLAAVREARAASPEALQARIETAKEAVAKSIAEYDRRLREGDTSQRTTSEGVRSGELDTLRNERDAMERAYREMVAAEKPKKSAEEIALQSYKTRTANRIAELEDRIARGDFTPKPKRELVPDKEATDLAFQIEKVKEQYNKDRFAQQLATRSIPKKILGGVQEVLNTARALVTSIDFSAVLRQGGFIVFGHPLRAADSILPMLRSFASEKAQFKVDQEINSRPNAKLYQQSKLYLAGRDAGRLSAMEEAYMSRWAKKIPLVAGSERAYTTFLNKLRADSFDAMAASLGRAGKVTPDEAAAISNFINVATGRGKIGAAQQVASGLNTVFFSPRYVASRFNLLFGQPLYGGSARTRIAVAKEYGRFMAGVAVVYSLASAAKDDEDKTPLFGTDPRSSDFGKIRFGNTRIDPLGGLLQNTVLISRLATGEKKDAKGKIIPIRGKVPYGKDDSYDVIANFARTKFSPLIGGLTNMVAGKNVIGEPASLKTEAANMVSPMSLRDVFDVMKDQGVPRGAALTVLSIFGLGVNSYDQAKKPSTSQ